VTGATPGSFERAIDYCVVDGVQVRSGTADDRARAHLAGDDAPRDVPLTG
jgi:hypothetical protein